MTEELVTYKAIGRVENTFDEPAAPDRIKAVESRIVLDPGLVEGLQGLEAGQQLVVGLDAINGTPVLDLKPA